MDPLVSIIVPVYNVKPYLNRCVDSLLGQSYQNMELLLADTAPPMAARPYVMNMLRRDARVGTPTRKMAVCPMPETLVWTQQRGISLFCGWR